MDEALDLKKVLDRSASSVSVEELSRKGFRTVKVLNQDSIQRLILDAVDRVLRDRAEEIGREERGRILAESRAEFDRLLAERMARERAGLDEAQERIKAESARLAEERARLEEERAELAAERERAAGRPSADPSDLREMLASIVAEMRAPAEERAELSEIRALIESLGRKISSGGAKEAIPDDEEALAAASLALQSEEGVESNLDRVEVKETKTSGVRGSLAKLRSMRTGGEGDAAGP